MLNRLLRGFKRPSVEEPTEFVPLCSLAQLEAIARLPVVRLEPFAAAQPNSDVRVAGPGAGGVIANLLRRNLLLTGQLSVLGIEDTGAYSEPLPEDIVEVIPEFNSCEAVVRGRLRHLNGTTHSLQLQVLRPDQEPEQFSIRFDERQLSELLVRITSELARRLGVKPTATMQVDWEANAPRDWPSLCLAGACWEQQDWPLLVGLAQQHRIHADALCVLSGLKDSPLTHAAFLQGSGIDHTNPQLLFFRFCDIWKGNTRHQPRAADLLRRSLLVAPGHGKSQMCLPHVTPLNGDSIPFALAHSRAGYRLLRTNAFALNNYCQYLQSLTPEDPQIRELFRSAIRLDPASPLGYRDAADFYLGQNRPQDALPFARALVKLCTPPVAERTIYCLRQNPALAAKLDRGELTPQTYAQDYLAACERGSGHD